MRMGTVADTIYLSAVALDLAAPSSSSLFLHKAVCVGYVALVHEFPLPRAHAGRLARRRVVNTRPRVLRETVRTVVGRGTRGGGRGPP